MQQVANERLPLKMKIGFGVGDIYGGGSLVIIGFYYLYFLTDVVRINPALAGIVFLVSKVWDAISDPLMGIISDRTRSRWGRRRPYFLFGIVLIFLSFFMMWYPVDFEQEQHRFVYMLVSYVFFSTVITMVMIPYNALSAELTLDYNERTSLMSIRIFFSTCSSLVCAVVPLEIVKRFPDVKTGYTIMAIAFGIFFALPFLATFLTTREREDFKPVQQPLDFRTLVAEPFKMKSFVAVLCMYVFAFVAMDALMTIVIYFMTYYLHQGNQTDYVLGTLLILQIVAIPFFYQLSKHTSKKTGYMVGALIWMITMLFSFLIRPGMPIAAMYVFASFVGIGTGGVIVMIYSIFPDIPDIDELQSSQRREGMYSGLFTFMRKLSSALAIFMISNAISLAGYKAPEKQVVGGVTTMVKQVQSPEFILTLRIVFAVLPVVFLLICLYAAARYPLSPMLHARLKDFLGKRRSGAEISADALREETELRKVLIGE
jgi:oligogalacturonide transporter